MELLQVPHPATHNLIGGWTMKRAALLLVLLTLPAVGQGVSDEFLQHWNYDKSAPLNIKQTGVEDHKGIKVYDITYFSPVGDRAPVVGPNGGIVAAYLVVPPGKGPFPAVIYSHWCMDGSDKKNRTEFLAEALVLARSGVISLLPDEVRVRPGFPEPAKDQSPLNEEQFALPVQQVINLRRGADLLLARNDVDSARLAYVGHSVGAEAGGYLTGVDKRLKAFVLMAAGLSDEVELKTKAYQDLRKQIGADRFDAFVAQHSWTDIGKYVSHAAPATVFLQYASHDDYFSSDEAKQYAEVVSEPKKFKIYDAPHALNAEATLDRVAFLAKQLSFRPPDAKAVARIPVLVQPRSPPAQ
jgi:dienelactone hydrolase